MSVSSVLSGIGTWAGGDQVKSQSVFTDFYPGYGFFGLLSVMTTDQMYQLKKFTSATLQLSGTPNALPKHVALMTGWTWIPCPFPASVPVADALPSFMYSTGDQLKSQTAFTEFYGAELGW